MFVLRKDCFYWSQEVTVLFICNIWLGGGLGIEIRKTVMVGGGGGGGAKN